MRRASRLFRRSGMSGQYVLAPFCGHWIDRFGPWTTSLSASILFASGWGWFAYEIHGTTYVGPDSPTWPFWRLVVACFLCGLATASSYVVGRKFVMANLIYPSLFTTLFSASRLFPRHTGKIPRFATTLSNCRGRFQRRTLYSLLRALTSHIIVHRLPILLPPGWPA